MAEWSLLDVNCSMNQFQNRDVTCPVFCKETLMPPPPLKNMQFHPTPQAQLPTSQMSNMAMVFLPGNSAHAPISETPREMRNRAEKMRRDNLNKSIDELGAIVPTVIAAGRKIDKTSVLRLTAHYLRSNEHVFGDSIGKSPRRFSPASIMKIMGLFNGFLLTVTYKGIIVVVSPNITQYLGYQQIDLLGKNLLSITHEDDRAMLINQLMPKSQSLGPRGELLIPGRPGAVRAIQEALGQEKRSFMIRFKKLGKRTDPTQYLLCHVEGTMRKSDRTSGCSRSMPRMQRVRARTQNPWSSGNDIVFVGMARPSTETFVNEMALVASRSEYRTRHTIDGQIIQCDLRIGTVTGYLVHEINGANALNFMHRDDVRWVAIALREMYDQQRLYGESCYRLITKNGQFIYMKTQGRLDVDETSRVCTSFVCTNTAVGESEGIHLIKMMRKKYAVLLNEDELAMIPGIYNEITDKYNENLQVPIEDPNFMEGVVLDLVIDLPSPPPVPASYKLRVCYSSNILPENHISFVPPDRATIVNGIERIYDVIKSFKKSDDINRQNGNAEYRYQHISHVSITHSLENPIASTSQERQVVAGPSNQSHSNELCNPGQSKTGLPDNATFLNAAGDAVSIDDAMQIFEKTLLDGEIESAINSINSRDTFDPNLPELLDPADIHELLQRIENEEEGDHQ